MSIVLSNAILAMTWFCYKRRRFEGKSERARPISSEIAATMTRMIIFVSFNPHYR